MADETTPRYGLLHVPVLSFFSRDVYRDMAVRWHGWGLRYLLFVVAVMLLPQALAFHADLRRVAQEVASHILKQMPTLQVLNNVVVATPPGPHTVTDPQSGQPIIRIDEHSTADTLEGQSAPVFITSTAVLMRGADGTVQRWELSAMEGLKMGPEDLARVLDVTRAMALPLLFPLAVLLLFAGQLLKVLLLAWVARVYTANMPAQLKFGVCMRLAVAAVTPAWVVGSLMDAAHLDVPASFVVATVSTFAFLIMGVSAVYAPEDEDEDPQDGPA